MSVTLGAVVLDLTVRLTPGADFITGLDSEDGDWPGTAVISLVFNDTGRESPSASPTVWTATIVGPSATWNVDKAEVAALIAALPSVPAGRKVRMTYTDGPTDLVWMGGQVQTNTRGA